MKERLNQEELTRILEQHQLYLKGKEGGLRVNLFCKDLTGLDFSGFNLRWACLAYSDLSGANFTDCRMKGIDLSNSNLTGANLSNLDLTDSNYTELD